MYRISEKYFLITFCRLNSPTNVHSFWQCTTAGIWETIELIQEILYMTHSADQEQLRRNLAHSVKETP